MFQGPRPLYKTRWYGTKHPFGSIPGFRTSLGIISLESIKEPIHGFVYDPDYASLKKKDAAFAKRPKMRGISRKQAAHQS